MQANPPSPQAMQANPPSPQAMQANPPSPQAGRGPGGRVYHAHLYGSRADKYAWLDAHDLSTAGYQPITPESPSYFFTPRQTQNLQTYQSWPSVTEIFPVNSVGIVTARDNLTIRWTPDEMWTTVLTFSQLSEELARTAFQLGKDARDWKVSLAQQDVKRDGGPHREKIVPILYRPFDVRYTYYTGGSRGFHCMPRPEVMRHMLAGENLALITHKREELDVPWSHALVTNLITEHGLISSKTTNYHFPLYLYPSTETPDMFHQERKPNLADWLLPKLSAAYGFTPTPEEVLAYIYAVLYSPTYRQKYAQELRTDFPRIPFTADDALFRQMATLGQQLIELHLLRSTPLLVGGKGGVKYQGQGSDVVEKVRYDPATGRVHINADKYFEGVTPEMWEYQIGGYQVLEKYLKDRKGRRLDDPVRYIHIASAIAETIRLQQQIDALYPQVEAQTI
jgi:predicted helicase